LILNDTIVVFPSTEVGVWDLNPTMQEGYGTGLKKIECNKVTME
jgi:hypothetical protein